jgi:sulfur carrier protein
MVEVRVNGTSLALSEPVCVAAVAERLLGRPPGDGVAIALNGEVVRRSQWDRVTVATGDVVDVVHAVQGG